MKEVRKHTDNVREAQEYVLRTAEALRQCSDIQKAFLEGYVKGLEMGQDKKAS